ncbi:MAG: nuclear transport factor 2 family protein [Altererythrobacter sp.]|nr:nuclear transport factor 2 family protein [Altererythrobacter sp.]OJU59527.1 MAG: hypothetical protein BGO08_00640 [Altererythrobacter sp. 66-12]
MKKIMMTLGLASAVLLTGCNQGNAELEKEVTALRDRIAIEDLLYDYYSHLGSGAHTGFDKFFTEDALLDVNGWKATGFAEIQKLYDGAGASEGGEGHEAKAAVPVEKEHMDYMHLTNPIIRVNGDTATAKMFWTGVISDDLNAPPKFEEMGREYDLLVKQNGEWKIKKRIIVADAGMPKSMNSTYKRMRDYDITKD